MSAGFDIAGEVFWGTNGAVESYVEALAEQAASRFGPDDRLTIFFREKQQCFFMGKVVFLDEVLTTGESRSRLLEALDAATEQLARYLWIDAGKTANARRHLEVPEIMQPYLRRLA